MNDIPELTLYWQIIIWIKCKIAVIILDIIHIPILIHNWLLEEPRLTRGEVSHALIYECAIKRYGSKENVEMIISFGNYLSSCDKEGEPNESIEEYAL